MSILSPGKGPPQGRSGSGTVGGGTQSYEESGVLRTQRHRGARHGVALLLCGAVVVMPLLLLQNGGDASASVHTAAASAAPAGVSVHRAPPHRRTRTAADPGPPPVAIDSAPVRQVVPTTTTTTSTAPPTTTTTTSTTVPPTTTTTHPEVMALSGVRTSGQVTYYAHPAGRCASPWLPFGTVVTITNPANDATVTCVVDDREADTHRSIDLATATFAELAPLSQGVVYARLSW